MGHVPILAVRVFLGSGTEFEWVESRAANLATRLSGNDVMDGNDVSGNDDRARK